MSPRTTASIPVASRISGFNYAIRNIVAEARKVEAAGKTVRYLNIGDPITFGFATPPHLIEAVERAIRDGHNGYAPSVGIPAAREAVAAECQRRGMPLDADRVVITAGTSEGIELALTALAGPATRCWCRCRPIRSTRRCSPRSARAGLLQHRARERWLPDAAEIRRLIGPATRALVVIDPNNPTGATYPEAVRRELLDSPTLQTFRCSPTRSMPISRSTAGRRDRDARPDAPVITFSSLSKAYLAPGWRAGWMRRPHERMDDVLARSRSSRMAGCAAPGPMDTPSSRR